MQSKKKTSQNQSSWKQKNRTFRVKKQSVEPFQALPSQSEPNQAVQKLPQINANLTALFISQVQEKIKNAWIAPLTAPVGVTCNVRVVLGSDGAIVNTDVFSPCKENPLLTSAIENALKAASPFPVPSENQNFKEFIFAFKFEASHSN